MQTSGLVLDVYDDVQGAVMRSLFSSKDDVPDLVKSAQVLSNVDKDKLPDDVFALVLINGDEKLRKYACIDEGNTALSILYFLKNAHKLPEEARSRTAENLKVACGWYDFDVPEELAKEAGALRTLMTLPSTIKGTGQAIQHNMGKVRAGEAQGGIQGGLASMAPGGIEHLASANLAHLKFAEATGTSLMPISYAAGEPPKPPAAGIIKKTGEALTLNQGVAGEAPKSIPQQHLRPHVNVTDSAPRKEVTEKKASRFAMPSREKYPLDSYQHVKMAAAYFDDYGTRMPPEIRHEYCVNLVKRASELSIPLSDNIRKYGSEKYASAYELQAALDTRRALRSDEAYLSTLDKLAQIQPMLDPEMFCEQLKNLDAAAGLHHFYDQSVADPYYTTYGFQKTAADDKASWSDVIGNYHVTREDLEHLAMNGKHNLKHAFGPDFVSEFSKDPVGIYESLPVEQKKLLIRLATENSPV